MDLNDFGGNILGAASLLPYELTEYLHILADNPLGQTDESTPTGSSAPCLKKFSSTIRKQSIIQHLLKNKILSQGTLGQSLKKINSRGFNMSRQQPAQAAVLLMAATFISRLLGYLRDVVLFAYFGQGSLTDAYYAAFTLPDFLYLLLVGSALGPVFIPIFSSYLAKKQETEAWRVANSIWNVVICFMFFGLLLAFYFAPQLIYLLVPGFAPETAVLAVELTRIMLPQAFFLALAGIGMGILHSYNNYLTPSIGSITYNVAILLVSLFLLPYWGIHGFAFGVTVGAFCYFLGRIACFIPDGLALATFSFISPPWRARNFSSPFACFIRPLRQPNQPLGKSTSSLLFRARNAQCLTPCPKTDAIAHQPFCYFDCSSPICQYEPYCCYSRSCRVSSLFPARSLQYNFSLSLPQLVGLIALGKPLLTLFYQQGAFSSQDVAVTYQILIFYCLGLAAYGLQQMLNRAFYAQGDTATPVKAGALSVVVNIVLNLILCRFWTHLGLALAYTLTGFFQTGLLFLLLKRRQGSLGGHSFFVTTARSLGLTLVMMVVVAVFCTLTPDLTHSKWQLLCQVAIATTLGGGVYLLGAKWLHMPELIVLQKRFSKR